MDINHRKFSLQLIWISNLVYYYLCSNNQIVDSIRSISKLLVNNSTLPIEIKLKKIRTMKSYSYIDIWIVINVCVIRLIYRIRIEISNNESQFRNSELKLDWCRARSECMSFCSICIACKRTVFNIQ